MKLLERSVKKSGRQRSLQVLAEQREPEKSYSSLLLDLFEKNGAENPSLLGAALVLSEAANHSVIVKLQKDRETVAKLLVDRASEPYPPISMNHLGRAKLLDPSVVLPKNYPRTPAWEVAHVTKPGQEEASLVMAALALVAFPEEREAILAVIRYKLPDLFDTIMKRPYFIKGNQREVVVVPALARLLGVVSDERIKEFNNTFLPDWKEAFQQSLDQFDGPKIIDKVWLENVFEVALALEVLEADRAYITQDGKPTLVRGSSLGTAVRPLPERLTA